MEWGELVEASRERDRDPETLTRTSIARPSFAPEAAVPAAPCALTHLSPLAQGEAGADGQAGTPGRQGDKVQEPPDLRAAG